MAQVLDTRGQGKADSKNSNVNVSDTSKENNEPKKSHITRVIPIDEKTTFIVVIGESGTGKSSLIKLLTNNDSIKTREANSTESCTKSNTFYLPHIKDIQNNWDENNHIFVDTVGTQDSDMKQSDNEIFNKLQKDIYACNGSVIKVVWIVKPNNTATATLKTQARFIQKLGSKPNILTNNTNNNDTDYKSNDSDDNDASSSIWNSVFMILSQPHSGRLHSDRNAAGAMDASKAFGCNFDKFWIDGQNLFGFTNIDWKDKKSDDYEDYWEDYQDDKKKRKHIYNNEELEIILKRQLSTNGPIKRFQIIFRNYRCKNCIAKGDPRFLDDVYCHASLDPSKNIENIKCHRDKDPIFKHLGDLADKEFSYKHSTKTMFVHDPIKPKLDFHPQPDACKFHIRHGDGRAFAVFAGGSSLSLIGSVAGVATLGPVGVGLSIAAGGAGVGASFYSLIKLDEYLDDNLCAKCGKNRSDDPPCTYGYKCCQKEYGSKGCWKKLPKGVNCIKCEKDYTTKGCIEACASCEKSLEQQGCIQYCNGCQTLTGKDKEMPDASKDSKGVSNCAFEWGCCKKGNLIRNVEDPSQFQCCVQKCGRCREILGESIGCGNKQNTQKHHWIAV